MKFSEFFTPSVKFIIKRYSRESGVVAVIVNNKKKRITPWDIRIDALMVAYAKFLISVTEFENTLSVVSKKISDFKKNNKVWGDVSVKTVPFVEKSSIEYWSSDNSVVLTADINDFFLCVQYFIENSTQRDVSVLIFLISKIGVYAKVHRGLTRETYLDACIYAYNAVPESFFTQQQDRDFLHSALLKPSGELIDETTHAREHLAPKIFLAFVILYPVITTFVAKTYWSVEFYRIIFFVFVIYVINLFISIKRQRENENGAKHG